MVSDDQPRMAESFPCLTADIVDLLRMDHSTMGQADAFGDLPYCGRCTCSPTCGNILTAPQGSPGGCFIDLELCGDSVAWLNLDADLVSVTSVEILEPEAFGHQARRELAGLGGQFQH